MVLFGDEVSVLSLEDEKEKSTLFSTERSILKSWSMYIGASFWVIGVFDLLMLFYDVTIDNDWSESLRGYSFIFGVFFLIIGGIFCLISYFF